MTTQAEPMFARAAITSGRGDLRLDSIRVGAPGPGEVRVRIVAAGLCHTDLASLSWGRPMVLGHEGAGVIEAVGPGVSDLAPGQSVVLNWAIPCGACPQCHRGRENICDRTHGRWPERFGVSSAHPGHTRLGDAFIDRSFHVGVFADYTVVRREAVTPTPAGLPLTEACILGCAVMTGVGSVINVAKVSPGESVAVIGCGGVGLNVVQGARVAGAQRIIAVDPRPSGLERALRLGATDVVQVAPEDSDHRALIAAVMGLTDDYGVDAAFEATGLARLSFLPLKLVRNGGQAIQVSGSHGEVGAVMPDFMWDKRYVTALYGGCRPSRDIPRLFDWVRSGQLNLRDQITHAYRFAELERAFDDLRSGAAGKAVILMDEIDHVPHG